MINEFNANGQLSAEALRQADRDRLVNMEKNIGRLEAKIDGVAQVLVSIARTEEKISTLQDITYKNNTDIQDLQRELNKLDDFKMTVRVINRVFWIVVSVASTIGAGAYFYGGG